MRTTVGATASGTTVTVTERLIVLNQLLTISVYTAPLSANVSGGVVLVKAFSSTRTPFFSQMNP